MIAFQRLSDMTKLVSLRVVIVVFAIAETGSIVGTAVMRQRFSLSTGEVQFFKFLTGTILLTIVTCCRLVEHAEPPFIASLPPFVALSLGAILQYFIGFNSWYKSLYAARMSDWSIAAMAVLYSTFWLSEQYAPGRLTIKMKIFLTVSGMGLLLVWYHPEFTTEFHSNPRILLKSYGGSLCFVAFVVLMRKFCSSGEFPLISHTLALHRLVTPTLLVLLISMSWISPTKDLPFYVRALNIDTTTLVLFTLTNICNAINFLAVVWIMNRVQFETFIMLIGLLRTIMWAGYVILNAAFQAYAISVVGACFVTGSTALYWYHQGINQEHDMPDSAALPI